MDSILLCGAELSKDNWEHEIYGRVVSAGLYVWDKECFKVHKRIFRENKKA